jgi:hypothetical protein
MRMFSAVLAGLLITAPFAMANDKNAQFKTLEPKHFTQAEGVELTPAFSDYFYAELRAELQKAKLANEVVGEGEAVDDADAPSSAVIVGTITEYKKGNAVKSALIGFTAGWQSLKMDADVQRRNDKQTLYTIHVHTRMDPRWNEKIMAKACAREIIKEMKNAQKAQPK